MEGYLHPFYAESFSEFGEPIYLPRSSGWLIQRKIQGTEYSDAMGPYPLFFCKNWDLLLKDISEQKDRIISSSFVIGPFEKFNLEQYKNFFDICRPYKNHYIFDTSISLEKSISEYSKRDARRALKDVSVDLVITPKIDLQEWMYLYGFLVKRHQIKGVRAFSKESFAKQISIPNTHFFRAWCHGDLVAGDLFYIQNDVAYGHLLALTEKGYQLGASHAIIWVALQYFMNKVKWVNFGGSTGGNQGSLTGLDKFKMGWSNQVSQSYFCGKILDAKVYRDLSSKVLIKKDWFPAYRSDDF